MRNREKILLIGIGELGSIILEDLCRLPGICEIVVADIDADWGFRKVNSAIEGASYYGLYPRVKFYQIDLNQIEQTAELISRLDPTVIFNGTTLQSWWVVNELPPEVNAMIYKEKCGLGPWSSMHLALTYRLMKAVRMSGIETYVVNSSFPDATNASLEKIGLAPTVGIGNIDLAVPYIRKTASELLNVPMNNVNIELIGHHYHAYHWCRDGKGYEVPHFLKVYYGLMDVTDQLGNMKNFIAELPKRCMRPAGRHGQVVVAASSVKNIMAIFNDTLDRTHAPGPNGLEGGYPVKLSRKGAELMLPTELTLDQARKINLEAQRYDGIEEIRNNGDIVLTEEAYGTFREMIGVDCKTITIKDSLEQAKELKSKFHEFARKKNIAT